MKVNLMLFSLFLLVSIMACNVFAFSISGGGSEASYKETEKNVSDDDNSLYKNSAITGDFVKNERRCATIKPHRRNSAPFSDKGELSYPSCAIASVTRQVNNHV